VSATITDSDYKREKQESMKENNTTHGAGAAAVCSRKAHT
jgi:hypothetical protein